jgi:hypothetical protein
VGHKQKPASRDAATTPRKNRNLQEANPLDLQSSWNFVASLRRCVSILVFSFLPEKAFAHRSNLIKSDFCGI